VQSALALPFDLCASEKRSRAAHRRQL